LLWQTAQSDSIENSKSAASAVASVELLLEGEAASAACSSAACCSAACRGAQAISEPTRSVMPKTIIRLRSLMHEDPGTVPSPFAHNPKVPIKPQALIVSAKNERVPLVKKGI
jgi:hypothetical protein